MDIEHAKTLIEALADGVNPITGELLPSTDSCNQIEITRALHSILHYLNTSNEPQKRKAPQPENAGKSWNEEEDAQLLNEYHADMRFSDIARVHGRTRNAIVARLERLGINTVNYAKYSK